MQKKTFINVSYVILFLILSFLLSANSAFAETKTFVREYTYQASEFDSKASCRVIALELVKRLLLEEIGTYLESETEVKNFQLTKDRITVLTAGIVRAEIIDESWDGNTLKYRLKAKITADPDSIIKSIDRLRNDQKKTKELEDVKKKADKAMAEIERLNKDLSATRADLDKMKQYNNAVNKLSATDWYRMAQEEDIKYKPNKELIISYYEKAISLDPEYAEAYARLGFEYMYKALFAEAPSKQTFLEKSIVAYEKAIEYNKDKEDEKSYYGLLAHAYSNRGYIDKAIAAREKSILLNEDVADLAGDYRILGSEYEKNGNYKKAISAFKKAIELKPNSINYEALGNAYAAANDHNNAIVAYKKAAELSSSYSNYNTLAYAYKANRNYDMAIAAFKMAITLEPNESAYAGLGSIYDLQGRKKEAKAAYSKAYERAYELAKAYEKKEDILKKSSAEELCRYAIRDFTQETKKSKRHWDVYDYLTRAIELRPDYALPHYWLGLFWLDNDYERQAFHEFKRAIELGFNSVDVYYWLGAAYYLNLYINKLNLEAGIIKDKDKKEYIVELNNMFRDGISILNKSIQLRPDYKNNYLVLGDIYRINGKLELATDNYKKANKILKPMSLESDKYMGKYYNSRKKLDKQIYDTFKSICDSGNSWACSWLSISIEIDPIKPQVVPAGSIELDPIVSP